MKSINRLFSATSILIVSGMLLLGCDRQEIRPVKQASQPPMMQQQATPQPLTVGQDRHIHIDNLHLTLPESWTPTAPTNNMRKAQFTMKAAEGAEPGEMAVFYFGPSAGGIESNLTRWYNQFEQPDGKNTSDVVVREEFEVDGMKTILIHFIGTMKTATMPGMPNTGPKTDWMNLSAIVVTPQGPWFFKSTGPAKTLKEHISVTKQFINGISLTHQG